MRKPCVGNSTLDWAIAFQAGTVKHVYFVAGTKGDITTMQIKKIEEATNDCARKFFARIRDDQVKYDFLKTYGPLMALVK